MSAQDPDNPVLFGTERDYAWNAWQTAYGAGSGTGADENEFSAWWERRAAKGWPSKRSLMAEAWTMGCRAALNKAPTFEEWWQQILDSQPAVTP